VPVPTECFSLPETKFYLILVRSSEQFRRDAEAWVGVHRVSKCTVSHFPANESKQGSCGFRRQSLVGLSRKYLLKLNGTFGNGGTRQDIENSKKFSPSPGHQAHKKSLIAKEFLQPQRVTTARVVHTGGTHDLDHGTSLEASEDRHLLVAQACPGRAPRRSRAARSQA
jgi:hypothetical protein